MASVLVGGVGSHHQLQKAWSGVNDMNKCKKVTEEEEETKVKGGDKMDVAKLLQQHVDLMDDMFKEVWFTFSPTSCLHLSTIVSTFWYIVFFTLTFMCVVIIPKNNKSPTFFNLLEGEY